MENLKPTSWADQEAAQTLLADDSHYIGAVARMGDHAAVVAAIDIVGKHGIKLVAKGMPVDSRILDKLLGHRLREPIDHQLVMANGVTPASLAQEAASLIANDPWWKRIAEHSGDQLAIRHGLARLTLPEALCIKLSVARDQRPKLFQHSLRVAMLAHYLALRLELSENETRQLLVAALCHDLGELHTDPAIFAPAHRITDAERHFIYVHPITGYLILKQLHAIDPQIAKAVLHHQERLDGSGYPAGLRGESISPLARVLTVADIAESVLAKFADHRRLSVMLRLNTKKYDSRAVAKLYEALGVVPVPAPQPLTSDTLTPRLTSISSLLAGWTHIRITQGERPDSENELAFLYERIHGLNATMLEFGFDPDSFGTLVAIAQEDREITAEMNAVLDEIGFQFAEMAQEIDRRTKDGSLRLPPEQQAAFTGWHEKLKAVVART